MTYKIARSLGAWLLAGFSSAAFAASMTLAFTPSNTAGNSASVTANVAYAGVTALGNGTQIVACYDSAKLTFVSAAHANPPGEFQPPLPAGPVEQPAGALCVAPANRQVLFTFVSFGATWPSNPAASGTLAPAGNIGTINFTTANPFTGSTNVIATENTALGGNYALGTTTGTLTAVVAPVPTAPTISPLANATLTGGTGSVPVNVATAGIATASVALNCTIPAGTAAFAVTSGGTRTVNAPATVGANAPAIGLSCTPQATLQTATLTCTQTATPAPNPANLTATITCPAVVVVPVTISATTPPGTVTLPSYFAGPAPGTSSTGLSFNTTGGPSSLSCVASGAGYSAAPNPLNLVVGTAGTVTVTYTGTALGTFAGTLTCTSNAPATGGPFVYNLSTTVQAVPPAGPAVIVPTMGAFGLGLMGLLIAGFAGFMQRRRLK